MLQVSGVRQYFDGFRRLFQVRPPILKATDDCQQLFIIDLVVTLTWRVLLPEVGDGVENTLIMLF